MKKKNKNSAFTLVEMLMALLIVSIILSASLPVITARQKAHMKNYNRYNSVPIGMIAIWATEKPRPDNTWLECNGQAIPTGIEYEEIRQIYGANLPDFRGMFLRGYGKEIPHTQENGTAIGVTTTYHSSGEIGVTQGDSIRNLLGEIEATRSRYSVGTGVFLNSKPGSEASYGGVFACDDSINSSCTVRLGAMNYFNASHITPTSNEVRPVNKAVRYIIKVRY